MKDVLTLSFKIIGLATQLLLKVAEVFFTALQKIFEAINKSLKN